jgi:hypothetical protein
MGAFEAPENKFKSVMHEIVQCSTDIDEQFNETVENILNEGNQRDFG